MVQVLVAVVAAARARVAVVEEAAIAATVAMATAAAATAALVAAAAEMVVVHLDLERGDKADKVKDAVNYHLKPAPISVVASEIVSDEFHARFDATKRHYLYRIINRRAPLTLCHGS